MNFEEDISLYDEIGEVIKGQLNKPRTRHLNTSLPSLEEQKEEIYDRKKLKNEIEKKIEESDFVSPPIDSDFANFAMKKYIQKEYPSNDKAEVDHIIKKYVGKSREEIPEQFRFVIKGGEKGLIDNLKSVRYEVRKETLEHVMGHTEKAVAELKTFSSRKQKNAFIPEVDFLSLSVEVFGYSVFSERIPIKLAVPFNRMVDSQICFVYEKKEDADLLRNKMELERFNFELLDFEDLEEYESDKEKLKLFINSFDFVVVDEKLRYLMYDYGINDVLQTEKKLVFSSLEDMVEAGKRNLESAVFSVLKYSNFSSMKIGLIDQQTADLFKNIENCVSFLLSYYPEERIRSIYLTVKESPKLYLFKNFAAQEMKNPKSFSKKRKREFFEDEVDEKMEDDRPQKKRKV